MGNYRSIVQRGSAEKKHAGTLLLCFEVYVLTTEYRRKRKTAQCSVPWQRHQQPDATKAASLSSTANLLSGSVRCAPGSVEKLCCGYGITDVLADARKNN